MTRKMVCPPDCLRRRVGCRRNCPDWEAHERQKAERSAAKAKEYASYPDSEKKEQLYRRKLRQHL